MKLPIDRGWAWVITFACWGIFVFISGNAKSRGIIMVELMEIYPEKSATALLWVFTVGKLMHKLSGPLSGMLLAKTSTRCVVFIGLSIMTCSHVAFAYVPAVEYMYFVYGVCFGLGNGMGTLSAMTAFAPYFDKKKALSLGLTTSGSGTGSIVIPLVLRQLLDNYSFSGAMLLYSGLCMQLLVLAALLRPFSFYEHLVKRTQPDIPTEVVQCDENQNEIITLSAAGLESLPAEIVEESREDDSKVDEKKKAGFNWKLIYDPKCVAVGCAMMMYLTGTYNILQCIPPLGKQSGLSKEFVSILLSASGAAEIPMKIFNGWLSDRKLVLAPTHVGCCMLFTGLMALVCAAVSGTAGIIAMLAGISLTGTSVFSLLPVMCTDLFGKANVQSAVAIVWIYQAVGHAISTFGSGSIYESTKRWENVYYFVFAFNITGSLIMFSITFVIRRIKKQSEERNDH